MTTRAWGNVGLLLRIQKMSVLPSRFRCRVFTCALATLLISCDDPAEREGLRSRFPDSLVGSWVQVYPPVAGKDTLVLSPDGTASWPFAPPVIQGRAVETGARVRRWQIGFLGSPNGLCIGGQALDCRNYLLRGDTLAFAGAPHTVMIRAGSMPDPVGPGDSVAYDRSRYGEVPRNPRPGR